MFPDPDLVNTRFQVNGTVMYVPKNEPKSFEI